MPKFEMDPRYIKLMSSQKSREDMFDCMIKAILKYHLACTKAARVLAADLAKCEPRPTIKKKSHGPVKRSSAKK